ncbi:MAG: hypothetical protein COV30_00285 [Candidatus Yanofskybacteria bacterium CG10_big_fil_rev_8_21_14_0_10_37_15]|uniref:SCP domain-containing protein n=1 Tax=Candidatus Yanofskybacteria bacterium CG10_big_fil_rev_8_21_14_0_10_37_15 TaxID=1975097 RepID=A0A2H0R6V4_9BACT|nr:MAG: hypothetical protein COV30_00285 [Candidatus Yanofskybacteria bacterium CG10_big_fil_rev_8_21_14_0_10_37_15]
MKVFLIKFRELLGHKILFINIAVLIAIKFAVPLSGTHFANLHNQSISIDSRQIISETNSTRTRQGLPALKPNSVLDLAAHDKLNDMIKNEYFAHFSPTGVSPWHWFDLHKYQYRAAGENLAVGFTTSTDTINAWLNSSGHRANLLNENFQEIGVATAYGNLGSSAQGIVVVQLFGTPVQGVTTLANNSFAPTKPSPTTIPQPSPITTSILNPILGETISNQAKETPKEPIPSIVPILVKYETSEIPNKINLAYIFYLTLITIILGISIMFHGLHKRTVFMTGAHLILIALAVFLPVLEIASIQLIV